MTTYLIHCPTFSAAIVVSGDTVLQAPDSLSWCVNRPFIEVRDLFTQYGWTVQPVIENIRPHWLEVGGKTYELRWNGDVLTRISLHENGDVKDLRFRDLPEQLRKLI